MKVTPEENINIFLYLEVSQFLQDVWLKKQTKNKSLTIRSWAQNLGLKHHNAWYEMVKGKRNIPKALIPTIIQNVGLSVDEGIFFELLVDLKKAKTTELKHFYLERMKTIAPRGLTSIKELESFKYLENPLHLFVAELINIKGFVPKAEWMAEVLNNKYSVESIHEIIDRLLVLKLITIEPDGTFKKRFQHTYSKSDVSDLALKKYHQSLMNLASEKIMSEPVEEREYNAVCFCIDRKNLQKIKKRQRDFVKSLISEFETAPGKGESLYQLNMQFFPLSKK